MEEQLNNFTIFLLFFLFSLGLTGAASSPEPGAGSVIFSHDFSDGMPEEFDADISYPDSGTWGRAHDLSGGGVYDPASIDNGRLKMRGPSCSYKGTAYPVTLNKDLQNWEIFYRVDARPGSSGHGDRITGEIRAVGAEPKGNYDDDYSQLARGRSGFYDYGSTYRIRGKDSSGDTVSRSASTDIGDIRNGKWNVRIATSKEEATTWVKYWQQGESEPEAWTHKFENTYLDGRPGFGAYGTCKGNSRYNYYDFYELRETAINPDLCDQRGSDNQCILNEEKNIGSSEHKINSTFNSKETAYLKAFSGMAILKIDNSTRLSGTWEGSFNISISLKGSSVVRPNASFKPENGRIIID